MIRYVRRFSSLALPWAVLLLATITSCASSGSSNVTAGDDVRVVFRDLRGAGTEMIVVNDGHLVATNVEGKDSVERRASYYSTKRTGAKPKVASDELMGKILQFFNHNDFETYAIDGPAPRQAGGNLRQTLEVSRNGRTRHLVAMPGMDKARGEAFRETVRGYARTFNEIMQLQTVPSDHQFEGEFVPATRRR